MPVDQEPSMADLLLKVLRARMAERANEVPVFVPSDAPEHLEEQWVCHLTNEQIDEMQTVLRKGWCKGTVARDTLGWRCFYGSRRARSWCLYGAALKVHCTHELMYDWPLALPPDTFNDRADSVDEVLAKLDELRPPR